MIAHLKTFTDVKGLLNSGQVCKVEHKLGCNVTVEGCMSANGIPEPSKKCEGAAFYTHQVYYNKSRITFNEKQIEFIFQSWKVSISY